MSSRRASTRRASRSLARRVASTLLLIMRVYFEKPRTTVGWKGLINDPDLDDSFHIEKGILLARELLLYVAELGLPAGTEALDPIMPQYLSELITWTAIGARTTESQTHREMASGLSTPVGFKNGTDGALATSINALQSVRHPHHFLGITQQGQSAVFRTRGNPHAHIVLRGGGGRVNYDAVSIALAERRIDRGGIAGHHRGRLQSRQFEQGPEPAAVGRGELRYADRRRQSLHCRPDARESPEGGKPIDPQGFEQARIRHVDHRSVHRLGRPPKTLLLKLHRSLEGIVAGAQARTSSRPRSCHFAASLRAALLPLTSSARSAWRK